MPYAEKTCIAPTRTRAQIEALLAKYGVKTTAFLTDEEKASVIFDMNDRRIRFTMRFPRQNTSKKTEQALKSRWRSLLMCIKAKMDSIETGIETFDEAFLAHVVMSDGSTIYEYARPRLRQISNGQEVPLLPAPDEMSGGAQG